MRRWSSDFLRKLAAALADDARAEVELAMRVGTLIALGYSRPEIARQLDASPTEIEEAKSRLKRVAPELETGYLPPEFTES